MYQFYLLSILLNVFLAVSLVPEFLGSRFPAFTSFVSAQCRQPDRAFLLGVAAICVGVFKLLSPVYGDVPFFGDLLPALTNLGGGGILVLENLPGVEDSPAPGWRVVRSFLLDRKDLWGYGCLGAGTLHFFLPTMIFF
ncbi:MAG: hypothetical protein Kow009_12130 [Spirochaetales bacterium]